MSAEEMEPIQEMAAFFDARAAGYDDYFRDEIFPGESFAQFYGAMSAPMSETDAPLRILDLGCGTGLELEPLFQRAPNARVTGVDLVEKMLELLRQHNGRLRVDWAVGVGKSHNMPRDPTSSFSCATN